MYISVYSAAMMAPNEKRNRPRLSFTLDNESSEWVDLNCKTGSRSSFIEDLIYAAQAENNLLKSAMGRGLIQRLPMGELVDQLQSQCGVRLTPREAQALHKKFELLERTTHEHSQPDAPLPHEQETGGDNDASKPSSNALHQMELALESAGKLKAQLVDLTKSLQRRRPQGKAGERWNPTTRRDAQECVRRLTWIEASLDTWIQLGPETDPTER